VCESVRTVSGHCVRECETMNGHCVRECENCERSLCARV